MFLFFLKASRFVALGFFLSFRSAALFSLIASSISAVTNGFFGLNLFLNFDGMWLGTTDIKVDCQEVSAVSMSEVALIALQSADRRSSLSFLMSQLSYFQIRRPGLVLFIRLLAAITDKSQ